MNYYKLILCGLIFINSTVIASPADNTQLMLRGDRLSGVVLPVLPRATDISIQALKSNAWTIDDTKRLLLRENVLVTIGAYTFEAEEAVVWLNRMPTDAGIVSQAAVYLPKFSKSSNHAAIGAEGQNLLVVGSTLGKVTLDVALMTPSEPKGSQSLMHKAETRLAAYLYELEENKPLLYGHPQVITAPTEQIEQELATATLTKDDKRAWLKPKSGFVSLSADNVQLLPETIENAVTLTGNVQLALRSTAGIDDMEMSATRGVIFLNPGSVRDMASGRVSLNEIYGVYLEGNVVISASEGNYLVRAPQIYYDFQTGKAVMVEAVLRTYIKDGKVPLFIRADELRQISTNQWLAQGVQASTSAFATPDLAIGATKMSITQRDDGNTYVKSEDNTLQFGGTPVMYWPNFEGKAGEIPLRRAKLGYKKTYGAVIETKWDLYTLLGKDSPNEVDADIRIDGFTKRGAGVGLDFKYSFEKNKGIFQTYLLSDSGTQRTDSGIDTDVTNSTRGYLLWENQTQLDSYWKLQTKLSYISDPTFMSVWRQDDYKNALEYETSIYAKYQKDNSAFTAYASTDLNQFISNSWLMASRQYQVDKTPEISLYNYGTKLFKNLITWSSETKITRERMVFQSGTPNELGLRPQAFNLSNANTPIESNLTSAGLQSNYQNRLVTRHELSIPLQLGAFKVVPFGSIQAQWGLGNEDDGQARETNHWFRTAGVRASTQIQRIFNSVNNELLDLHRLRHVIEPYMTVWNGDSNVDVTTIPQYDAQLDNLSTGTVTWFGVKNKLQTWRGGPGRWYQVDWLTIDTAFMFANSGAVQRYDNPQFFDWRPEYSSIEDAAILNGKWQYSDGVAFIGNGTWGLDGGRFSRGSVGAELDHGKDVRTYIEYREIDVTNDQFLSLGMRYNLSKRYSLDFSPSWNFNIDDLQSLRFMLTRHYPDFDLVGQVRYNQIQDETSVGFRFNLLKF